MSLQSQIQNIIDERKSRVEKIQSEIDNIDKLTSNLEEVKKRIQDLNLENANEYADKIQAKIDELTKAKIQALHLRERFDKKTINIGVSGFTHAGKSTLLQAISGLTDEEIPKADVKGDNYLHATTAICSQIFNSSKEYAEIIFKNEEEFVESVNIYTKKLSINKISNKSEIENITIPNREDGEPEKNTAIARLSEIKEAYQFYSNKIDYKTKTSILQRNEFNTLSYYVSCQASCKEKRFYPAVKEVKIYCKFPSFIGENEDTKICLVDLPGFGNFDDEIQTRGLREKVDHIIFIYKTDNAQAIDNDQYIKCQRTILDINNFKTNKLDFESFIINEDKNINIWEKLTKETLESIKLRYGNYKTFNFSAYAETDKSREVLNEILKTLTTTLPKMDDELIESYMKNRDLSEMSEVVNEILSFIEKAEAQNEDSSKFAGKGRAFRENFSYELGKLLKEYQDTESDLDFENKINSIKDDIDTKLKENLLYVPTKERPTWEVFVERSAKGGLQATFGAELHRIWIGIICEYVKLDEIFTQKLSILKKQIMSIFVRMTGNLVENKEADNFDEIIEKLNCISDNQIYKAFVSINALKQDFRQNLYPYIFKNKVNNLMEVKGDMVNSPNGQAELDMTSLTIENYKSQLVNLSKSANYEISKVVKSNYVSSYFLIGVLHTFNESITYSKTENDDDFVKFCSIFRKKIYPDEYGSEADSVKMAGLKTCLKKAKNLILKF